MQRYILTGAPGAGKTAIIRRLEFDHHSIVEEAATDIIALDHADGITESWRDQSFTERIATLQEIRLASAAPLPVPLQFHDRSIFCTHALAEYLEHPIPPSLDSAIEQALAQGTFQPRVFFVRLLGFITHTEARRISLEDSQRFERVHEATYRRFGFDLIDIAPGSIDERIATVLAAVASQNPALV
jgi:predicted ATPase